MKSVATPYRSPEIDDGQKQHLMSSSGAEEDTFIKEPHVKWMWLMCLRWDNPWKVVGSLWLNICPFDL